MQVFHWSQPYSRPYSSRVGCKRRWSGTKIHKKGRENAGLVAPPRQDMIHPGLSGSRGRPALGSGCFLKTGLETTRTSPKPLTDKPCQAPTSHTDKQTGLEKYT